MPPRKKVIGYDQQTGQAIYEEALPSPMQDDPLAPLPAVDTVPLDEMDTMNGVSADPYADAPVPQDVADDVAAMELPQTGVGFDFNSINVQTREDFDRLPPEQQELLKAMKRGVQFTPESAAQFITSQMTRQQKLADETSKAQNDPRGQAIAKQQAQQSQSALDSVQNMRQTVTDLMEHPGFSGSVGAKNQSYLFGLKSQPVAGTKEADFKAMLDQVQGGAFLQAFQSLRGGGQITQVEGEKATQAIVRAQQSQSEEGFKKSMNDFLSVLDKAEKRATSGEIVQQPSTPAATAAAPRPTKTISGIVWEKGDDGKWYRKR
jgi:hypothetical protein